VKKHVFNIFYLQINVFNIYGYNKQQATAVEVKSCKEMGSAHRHHEYSRCLWRHHVVRDACHQGQDAFSQQAADNTQWADTIDWTVRCDWLQVASVACCML